MVDSNAQLGSLLGLESRLLELLKGKPSALADFDVVAEAGTADCWAEEGCGTGGNRGSSFCAVKTAAFLTGGLIKPCPDSALPVLKTMLAQCKQHKRLVARHWRHQFGQRQGRHFGTVPFGSGCSAAAGSRARSWFTNVWATGTAHSQQEDGNGHGGRAGLPGTGDEGVAVKVDGWVEIDCVVALFETQGGHNSHPTYPNPINLMRPLELPSWSLGVVANPTQPHFVHFGEARPNIGRPWKRCCVCASVRCSSCTRCVFSCLRPVLPHDQRRGTECSLSTRKTPSTTPSHSSSTHSKVLIRARAERF